MDGLVARSEEIDRDGWRRTRPRSVGYTIIMRIRGFWWFDIGGERKGFNIEMGLGFC
jgi:hypothetical protein